MFRLLAFITATLFAITANAQSHDDARHRLVSLSVTSQDPETGERNIASSGTGFFISADGFILTTEHILDAHRKKDGKNTIIKGRTGGTDTVEYVVKFVSEERNLDLLLLRAILPFGTPDPSPFKLGATSTISPNTGTQFKSSGFANGAKWTFEDGSFIDMDNETGYGWRLKMAINPGQSGSPVYLEDGETVIGILKGSHKDILDESIMIPIEYAMPLIGHVKIADLERKVDRLDAHLAGIQNDLLDNGRIKFSGTVRPTDWSKTDQYGNIYFNVEKDLSGLTNPRILVTLNAFSNARHVGPVVAYLREDNSGFKLIANTDFTLEKVRDSGIAAAWVVMSD